jgi:hypothetical protein
VDAAPASAAATALSSADLAPPSTTTCFPFAALASVNAVECTTEPSNPSRGSAGTAGVQYMPVHTATKSKASGCAGGAPPAARAVTAHPRAPSLRGASASTVVDVRTSACGSTNRAAKERMYACTCAPVGYSHAGTASNGKSRNSYKLRGTCRPNPE